MLTEVSEWLQAFYEDRSRPTAYQLFRERTTFSAPLPGGQGWAPNRSSLSVFQEYFGPSGNVPADYVDTHCWAFTPESFELLVRDLIAFGLLDLRIESVSATFGFEFYVDLVRPTTHVAVVEEEYYATRERLLRCCVDERPSVPRTRSIPRRVMREVSRIIRQIRSAGRAAA